MLLSDGYVNPRKVACDIISKVSFKNYEYNKFSLAGYVVELNKDLDRWIENWSYGKKAGDLKAKILLINLLRTNKENGKLILPPTFYSFVTEKLSLDHLEANNPPEGSAMTYYFVPKDSNDDRKKWVNGLGNFMILDQENNNEKNNKPLQEALVYYDAMCKNHWLIEDIKEMMNDDNYSEAIEVDGRVFRKPTERFFSERRVRLHKWIRALLSRDYNEKEMIISK